MLQRITQSSDLANVQDNLVIGTLDLIENARVEFRGTGNILAIDGEAKFAGSIVFHGDNSVVHLMGSNQPIRLAVEISPNCVFHNGANSYFNGAVRVIVSEHQTVYFGDEGTYSFGIWVRTADAHLIYDSYSRERINQSAGVYIGDRTWLGQEALLLKGVQVGSGAIVGARAVVSGKQISSNSIWGGVPAVEMRRSVFFDSRSTHGWTVEQSERARHYTATGDLSQLFGKDPDSCLTWSRIDSEISQLNSPALKLEYLRGLPSYRTCHDRHYIP